MQKKIDYPFVSEELMYEYVTREHPMLLMAMEFAKAHSLDEAMPTASVIVRDGKVLGRGTNGSTYHQEHACERVKQGIPTGQGYELCEGCHPKNHSELKAIANAVERKNDTQGASLYLWGHWWCCQSCCKAMEDAGITHVYLAKGSEILFNRDSPGNIIGHQFELYIQP